MEETDQGWFFVSCIEGDAGILARKEAVQRQEEAERAAEEAQAKQMEGQRIEAAKALDRAGGSLTTEATAMELRGEEAQPTKWHWRHLVVRVALAPSKPKRNT